MEYYPLQDITTNQYWKLKVTNGMLHLEENSQSESKPNPIINDKDGTTWILYVENGYLKLTDTTTQPDTQFYLHDPAGDVWRVIVNNGVIGIEKMSKEQTVLNLSHCPLDVRSGKWTDLSRKGNHGMPYGGARPYMIAPGVMGFEFDGSSGYIDLPLDIFDPDAGAWQGWINLKSFSGSVRIFSSRHSSGTDSEFRTYAASTNEFWFALGLGDTFQNANIGSWVLNQWWNVCYTWKKSGSVTIMKGYKNGVYEATSSKSGSPQVPDICIHLGEWRDYYTEGIIAEFNVYKHELSQDEVRENMYHSPIYRMLRGLPYSVYIKVPQQTQGGIYVP